MSKFPKECESEGINDKISVYLNLLRPLLIPVDGQRSERAKKLLARYREANGTSYEVSVGAGQSRGLPYVHGSKLT
ncbi:10404_t:CDS:2, partial [Ambispora leptoticha]